MLDSWKAIAAYLHRDVRTVIRWERDRGLPVHRLPGGGRSGVYALIFELEAWRTSTNSGLAEPAGRPVQQSRGPSVALLPFANLNGDPETEYFSDGLADEVITALTRIPGLMVTARRQHSAFR